MDEKTVSGLSVSLDVFREMRCNILLGSVFLSKEKTAKMPYFSVIAGLGCIFAA